MREADYDAYDLDDPKHPDWEDAAADRADLERKREKEDALFEADGPRVLLAPERTQGFPLSRAERKPMRRGVKTIAAVGVIAGAIGLFLLLTTQARAQPRPPVPPDVFQAVRTYWKTRTERIVAFDVVACETGGRYNTTASNGQYLGLFQMGQWARARYGHGSTAQAQARAAHRYWLHSGWSGWACG